VSSPLAGGRIAYEAYSDAIGGRSFVTNTPLPPWDEVDPLIRKAWIAAAQAVLNDFMRGMKPVTDTPTTIPKRGF
jgi:hypothetical protein